MAELNPESLEDFVGQFTYLSGDMELPLEDKLPGPFDFMSYRISANEHCGLMFYYFHDEVIFASVFLTGSDFETETELLDTFRYLLMETDDMEEDPTEEEIVEKLSTNNFLFNLVTERPATIEIKFPARDDELKETDHAQNMNRHSAAAFFQHVLK